MAFSFNSLNNIRSWDFQPPYDTSDPGNYVKLQDLYEGNSPDEIYIVRGCFINPKSQFVSKVTHRKEAGVIMLDEVLVNVPDHQIGAILSILENPEACAAINAGLCGFTIRKYWQSQFNKDCYSIDFIDIA